MQLVSAWHCTQRMAVESQTGAADGQSIDERQPTHAPVLVSQMLGWPIPMGQGAPPSPQAAWHVWLPGQQTGVVPLPQSLLVTHVTQLPFKQCGAAVEQSEFVKHWTHPWGTPGPVQRVPAS